MKRDDMDQEVFSDEKVWYFINIYANAKKIIAVNDLNLKEGNR